MSLQSQQVQLTAAGVSTPCVISTNTFHYGVGLLVTVGAGVSCTYTVEVSGDKRQQPLNTWNSHDVLKSLTASANSSLAFPVMMVRLNVVNTNGPVTLSVIQATG